MKLKILTTTFCISMMGYSGACLAETTSTEPSENCNACQCTLDNYLGAWPEFISSARSIYEIAQDGSQLKELIKNDLNQVCGPDNDYSHNHMKNFFQHIKDNAISTSDKKKYAAFETDYNTLETQYNANEKRVHDWKACPKTDSNGKACKKKACSENPPHPDDYSCWPCKDSYAPPPAQGCDLGTAGTPCENTTITCDTIS